MASRRTNQSNKVDLDALDKDETKKSSDTSSGDRKGHSGAQSDSGGQKKKQGSRKDSKTRGYDVDADRAERAYTKEMIMSREADDDDAPKKPSVIDRFKSLSMMDLVWVTLVPALVLALIAGIITSILSGGKEVVEAEPENVQSVEGVYSILDDVESLKDDQITSLRKQIASLKTTGNSAVSKEEADSLMRMSRDATDTLDPFFSAVLGISRNAKASELSTHQKNLSEYMTDEASTSIIYDFLNGPTPAKQLNQDVRKSGRVIPTWSGSSENGVVTYVIYVPIVSESGTAHGIYTVTLERDNRISNINYNGLLIDGKTPVPSSLADQLRGDENKSGDYMQDGNIGDGGKSVGESASANANADTASNENADTNDGAPEGETQGGDQAKSFSDYDARKDDVVPAPGT